MTPKDTFVNVREFMSLNTMESMSKLINRMRLHKVKCSVVYQCAMLQRRLAKDDIESEIVQGFISIGGQGCCRHYWVETNDGTQLDIGTAYGTRIAPEMTKYMMQLSRDPVGVRFDQDQESAKVILENETHYELLQKNPKQFWLENPSRNFRV